MSLRTDQHNPVFSTSNMSFRAVVVVGAALTFGLIALLLLRDESLPAYSQDQTLFMLQQIQPSHSEIEPITPLPKQLPQDPRKVALGRRLFMDTTLSQNHTVSCATCHNLALGGADGQPRSIGIEGQRGDFNAPTVFNSGFNFRQFWDGRAMTLEDQVNGPLENPREMGIAWKEVLTRLAADTTYQRAFAEAYPVDGMTPGTVRNAIATFERALATPDAPFDRWLRGDKNAISAEAAEGYQLFKTYGCVSCHQGANVGGNMFERIGLVHDFFSDRGRNAVIDQGRYNLTGDEADRHEFKVPSLRNVALTAPYFHDGSVSTLNEAIKLMAYYQLGLRISDQDVRRIEAFLGTLTGKLQEGAL